MKIPFLTVFNHNIEAMTKKASGLIDSRFGLWFLGLLSFVESALLIPIITDPFMVAYIMVHRSRAVMAVLVTTVTSVFGGFVAYITAAFMIDLVLNLLSPETIASFYQMIENYRNDTFILAILGALTPIPFTLTALVAGTIKGNLIFFLLGAFLGRLVRYGIVGYLTYRFGNQTLGLARKNIGLTSAITVIIVAVYIWHKM
ncbi:MAG TPA: VTT domain-containing protein [Candidatus Paceibacterota bacterium]|nr:VTT domain-containing protein [Candidatus Paceibacterota bacterium]HMO82550.1 VTT domain-containing protein [Candidatus Paceibacterota bacterium]